MPRFAYGRRVAWYVVSGILFIFTGLLLYFHVSLPSVGGIILIVAGATVILLGLLHYHPTPDALGVFIISLLVFGLFTSSPYSFASGNRTFSFTRTRYVSIKSLSLSVSESFGSVDVSFVNDPNLLLNLTYSQPCGVFPFFIGSSTVTNTSNPNTGMLAVSGSSTGSSIGIVVSTSVVKVTSLNISTSTGSVSIDASNNPNLTALSVETSTGSISITVRTTTLTSLRASSSTGSVEINAHYLGLSFNSTLDARSSTGSVSLDLTLNPGVGCFLSASSRIGIVSPSLSAAFQTLKETNNLLQARSSNYSSVSHSVTATLTSSTGSVDVTAQ